MAATRITITNHGPDNLVLRRYNKVNTGDPIILDMEIPVVAGDTLDMDVAENNYMMVEQLNGVS